MADYVTKIRTENGDKQIDYNALANLPKLPTIESIGAAPVGHTHTPNSIGAAAVEHAHLCSDISDFPKSLPANGGNADTLGGKVASEFALTSDVEQLKTKVDGVSLVSFGVTVTADELNYLDGVTSNIQKQLGNKSDSGHTHNDRYYEETEVDALLANKANTFESGVTVLSAHQYGPELPEPGTVGRVFFKKVNA